VTIPALVGPIVGPPLGGFITTYFDWRWIFWINVPIGIFGALLAGRLIRNIKEPHMPPLDWRGLIMTGIGCSGLIFGFEFLGRGAFSVQLALALIAIGAAALALYVWHAGRTTHPLLNLSLLKLPTFRASISGGFLFRMGIGAVPFLLPLMLQVGFGFSPLHSGLLTFVAAAGALAMKFTAPQVLRRFGFRPILVWNSLLCGVLLGCYAFIRADSPALFIWSLLLISGFFRSLLFTSLNSVAYAEVTQDRMSAATSFASMAQQLAASVGVGVGAIILHVTGVVRGGGGVLSSDFTLAFLVVALISAASPLMYRGLAPDAGSELLTAPAAAGKRQQPRAAE